MASSSPRAGVFCVRSRLTDPVSLPAPAFMQWYDDVHIPDLLAAGVPAAWRYETAPSSSTTAADPSYLVVYKLPDIAFVHSAAFKAVPFGHPSLPGGGPIGRFAEFQGRFTTHVETWTSARGGGGEHAPLLVWEFIEPAVDDGASKSSIDAWYRQSYMADTVSKMPAWRTTSRFATAFARDSKDDGDSAGNADGLGPKKLAKIQWLALHEFDGGSDHGKSLQAALLGKMTSGTGSVVEVAQFRLVRGFGNDRSLWVD